MDTPDLPALIREDLHDAIEYAGLRSWLIYPIPYPSMLYTANAAFAGSGRGLCHQWWDIDACQDEVMDSDIPLERLSAVTYVYLCTTLHFFKGTESESIIKFPTMDCKHGCC